MSIISKLQYSEAIQMVEVILVNNVPEYALTPYEDRRKMLGLLINTLPPRVVKNLSKAWATHLSSSMEK